MNLLKHTNLLLRKSSASAEPDILILLFTRPFKGIVINWSAAEMKGLKLAIGDEHAKKLLKGCQVHWIRLCQRVCDRICKSSTKINVFKAMSTAITCLKKPTNIIACFQALCGERSAASMTSIVTSLNSKDAKYVDKHRWALILSTAEGTNFTLAPFPYKHLLVIERNCLL